MHSVVSQGCKPIGEPLTVTHAEKNVLLTLGSRPAYEVLSDVYERLPPSERPKVLKALESLSTCLEKSDNGEACCQPAPARKSSS